jgi:hypothetical protein
MYWPSTGAAASPPESPVITSRYLRKGERQEDLAPGDECVAGHSPLVLIAGAAYTPEDRPDS